MSFADRLKEMSGPSKPEVLLIVELCVPKWVTPPRGCPQSFEKSRPLEWGESSKAVEEAKELAADLKKRYPTVSYFIEVISDDGEWEYDSMHSHFHTNTNPDVLKKQFRKEFIQRFR